MEIYVGNIPPNIQMQELHFLFQYFGRIVFVDIKTRCEPPFAFVLFDNTGSALNATQATQDFVYNGYKLQVRLLTPEVPNKLVDRDKPPTIKKIQRKKSRRSVKKSLPTPPLGKPGGLDDCYRLRLSGAGTKWYLRYLKKGIEKKEARIKAEEHKFLAMEIDKQEARKKAEEEFRQLEQHIKKKEAEKRNFSKMTNVKPKVKQIKNNNLIYVSAEN